MHGYWASRGLAQKGHRVFVVTNANEVEADFRLHLTEEDLADGGEYARTFQEVSGSVNVYSTELLSRAEIFYIPANNPTVTRLASVAADVIRAEKCELIFTYYLEPYALAAHLAGSWTGVPYVFKHAGSDLYRLFPREDLQTAYLEVLRRANRIISSGGMSGKKLKSLGIPPERIISDIAFELPDEYFNPDARPLDINSLLSSAEAFIPNGERLRNFFAPLDDSLPILGIYGKVGEYKGTFDLLHAMSRLIRGGFPFHLVAMSNAWRSRLFLQLVEELGIARYVRIIPFQPHWRVPGFIRSCTAVTFLERDFPITAHTPTIPSEIIACGKCLITSEEIARKQPFRMRIRNLQNLIVVPDPKDYNTLAKGIRYALESQQRADEIGMRAHGEFAHDGGHREYIDRMESLFLSVAAEAPVSRSTNDAASADTRTIDVADAAEQFFPSTYLLLSDEQKARIRVALAEAVGERVSESAPLLPITMGVNLLASLNGKTDPETLIIREVCRYENKVHEVNKQGSPPEGRAPGPFLSGRTLESLLPSIRGTIDIIKFACDINAVTVGAGGDRTPQSVGRPISMLFHPNSPPHKINGPTEHLLSLIAGGSMTVNEILQSLSKHYGCEGEPAYARLKKECLSVLEGLYWAGIIKLSSPEIDAGAS